MNLKITEVFDNSRLSSLRNCPICLDTFKEPKALPCLHAFCNECIRPMISRDGKINCPVCRKRYFAPKGLQKSLVSDHRTVNLVDIRPIQAYAKNPCAQCKKAAAVAVCIHCCGDACWNCLAEHAQTQLNMNNQLLSNLEKLIETAREKLNKAKLTQNNDAKLKQMNLRKTHDELFEIIRQQKRSNDNEIHRFCKRLKETALSARERLQYETERAEAFLSKGDLAKLMSTNSQSLYSMLWDSEMVRDSLFNELMEYLIGMKYFLKANCGVDVLNFNTYDEFANSDQISAEFDKESFV